MRTEVLKYGRIRDLRIDRGLTQAQVAEVLHVSQYGVSVDYLVGLTDETAPYPRRKK